jgi:hypothetical protein
MDDQSREWSQQLAEDNTDAEIESETHGIKHKTRDSGSSQASTDPWLTSVFDKSPESPEDMAKLEKRTAFIVPPDTAPYFLDPRKFDVPLSNFPEKIDRPLSQQRILTRPLPEIPTRDSSLRHTRNASTSSHAPSISPSLRSYVERETTSPDPIIGVASVVPLPRSKSSGESFNEHRDSITIAGPPITAPSYLSPPSATASKRRGMASPPLGGLFNLPNITIRRRRPSPAKHLPRLITSPPENDNEDRSIDDYEVSGNMTTLSLSESEWMCRTPSPVRNDPEHAHDETLWSQCIDGNRVSKDGSALRKKAMDWHDEVRYSEEADDSPQNPRSDEGLNIRFGNWI